MLWNNRRSLSKSFPVPSLLGGHSSLIHSPSSCYEKTHCMQRGLQRMQMLGLLSPTQCSQHSSLNLHHPPSQEECVAAPANHGIWQQQCHLRSEPSSSKKTHFQAMKNIKGQSLPIHFITTFSQINKMLFTIGSVQCHHYNLGQCHGDFFRHFHRIIE